MEEIKNGAAEISRGADEPEINQPDTETKERTEAEKARQELREKIKQQWEEQKKQLEEASEALKQGKGRMRLETPIRAHDTEFTELQYDFTSLKGHEYTDAMDSDINGSGTFNITRRQALALFAKAAAKQIEGVDMQDIIEQIGGTDAIEAVEIATLFFNASRRAGRMRISKL